VACGEDSALAMIDGCSASWVVSPTHVDQVAAVAAFAHRAGLIVAARGSGSTLELGHPPRRIDVVVDMRRLDRVAEYNPDELTVSLEAGLTAGALAERLAPRRQWLPLDPPGWRGRTFGGLVATNAHGPLRARYGTLRDLVLGVRFVQADGVVTWGGARVVKSVTGYDVPKLMVGALGSLGLLVEVALRLHPMPEAERTWMVSVASAERAQAVAARILDSTLQPNRMEFLNAAVLRACAVPAAPAAVAIAIGSAADAVTEQGERLEALVRGSAVAMTVLPEEFWSRYEAAFRTAAGDVVLLVGTLPSRYGETITEIERQVEALGSPAHPTVAGCMASGTLRVRLTGVPIAASTRLVSRLREFVGAVNGSVVLHAGPPDVRTQVDPWGPVEPAALDVMRRIKHEFDPTGVLNAGRFVAGL
jgi:glycolate oxidase FAD binding subunit